MPLKLITPIEKEFTLDRSDRLYGTDGEPTKVTIRQATQAHNEKRAIVYSEITQEYNREEGMRSKQRFSVEELKRIEVFLTLVGCNIVGQDGKSLFRFRNVDGKQSLDMTDREFAVAWGELPPDVASEIHEKVWEVNLTWAGPLA